MVARSGGPSPSRIDREWPFQVALLDDLCVMHNLTLIMDFCRERGIAYVNRHANAIWSNGRQELFRVHCFGDLASAEAFRDHFGGVLFDPKRDREGGRARGVWHRSEEWTRALESGPLRVPAILRN